MAPRKPPPHDPQKLSFEQALAELEGIIDRIQNGEIGLEESLAEYERAAGLLKRCRSVLDATEQKVEKLQLSLDRTEAGNDADDRKRDAGNTAAEPEAGRREEEPPF